MIKRGPFEFCVAIVEVILSWSSPNTSKSVLLRSVNLHGGTGGEQSQSPRYSTRTPDSHSHSVDMFFLAILSVYHSLIHHSWFCPILSLVCHMYMYICIYVYMYVYVYIYICMYTIPTGSRSTSFSPHLLVESPTSLQRSSNCAYQSLNLNKHPVPAQNQPLNTHKIRPNRIQATCTHLGSEGM